MDDPWSIARAAVVTAMLPLARVEEVLKVQDTHPRVKSGEVPRYRGMLNCLVRLAREQGFTALYRGLAPNVVTLPVTVLAAEAATRAFEATFPDPRKKKKDRISKAKTSTDEWVFKYSLVAVATLSGAATSQPIAYAIHRRQFDVGQGPSRYSSVLNVLTASRFTALYAGLAWGMAGSAVHTSLLFVLASVSTSVLPQLQLTLYNAIMLRAALTQAIVVVGSMAEHPFGVVASRLQLQADQPKAEQEFKGGLDAVRKTVRTEGLRALWKGFGTRFIRVTSTNVILAGVQVACLAV